MGLEKLTKQERNEVIKLLTDYWKDRGMPQYNKTWAKKYLTEGHKKETKKDEFFVFKEKNKLIGIIALITDVSNVAQIRDMVVKPEYRGKGYGKVMLNGLIKLAKKRKVRKLYAFTFPKLEKFLKSSGFEKEGILKSHFAPKEDLIIMSKFL